MRLIASELEQWVDLESTPFKKNWLLYAEVAKHMSENGYTVMVSTHEEMLNALELIEANYTVVIPPITDKATYIRRYDTRGNTYDFIRLLEENWDKWINVIIEKPTVLKTIVVLPKDGCIKAFADAFGKHTNQDQILQKNAAERIDIELSDVDILRIGKRYFELASNPANNMTVAKGAKHEHID